MNDAGNPRRVYATGIREQAVIYALGDCFGASERDLIDVRSEMLL